MVWFQCEECGGNLKKPKLLGHFNRCAAYKLSCIDCGVVFDQHSVQFHTSCVTEVEKYGPKGVHKVGDTSAPRVKDYKGKTGVHVDVSWGLSTSPPWSCSLCNVKATSRETLDQHSQGKKHRSRAKAAAAKEISMTKTEVTGNGISKNEMKDDLKENVQITVTMNTSSQFSEIKGREQLEEVGNPMPKDVVSANLGKKLKCNLAASVNNLLSSKVSEKPCGGEMGSSKDKKRKHEEKQEDDQSCGKKSRKKDKLVSGCKLWNPEKNGDCASKGEGNEDCPEEKKGKNKEKNKENVLESPFQECFNKRKGQTAGIEGNFWGQANGKGVSLNDPSLLSENGDVGVKEGLCEQSARSGKKERKIREAITPEVSFREWLGEDDMGSAGTPTHPLIVDLAKGSDRLLEVDGVGTRASAYEQLENLRSESMQDEVTKVVKWKKLIKDVLRKSLTGRLKRKDLAKVLLPVAVHATESSSVSVDRKSLKAELMKQVNGSSKFVVDGKYVMLAPRVK